MLTQFSVEADSLPKAKPEIKGDLKNLKDLFGGEGSKGLDGLLEAAYNLSEKELSGWKASCRWRKLFNTKQH